MPEGVFRSSAQCQLFVIDLRTSLEASRFLHSGQIDRPSETFLFLQNFRNSSSVEFAGHVP